jgi:hypothetical protein
MRIALLALLCTACSSSTSNGDGGKTNPDGGNAAASLTINLTSSGAFAGTWGHKDGDAYSCNLAVLDITFYNMAASGPPYSSISIDKDGNFTFRTAMFASGFKGKATGGWNGDVEVPKWDVTFSNVSVSDTMGNTEMLNGNIKAVCPSH